MAEIIVPGPISGRNYGFRIKGDAPTVDEQQRIDGILRQREAAFQQEYAERFGAPVETGEGEGVLNYLGEFPKGIGRGAVGMLESALLGGAAALPEQYEAPTREFIRSTAYNLKPQTDMGLEETVSGKFGEALGSFGALGIATLLPGGQALAPALAIGAGAGEASERARAAGATEEERGIAALMGAPVGALELIPIKFIKVLGAPATGTIKNYLARAAATGGVEGAQEAAATIAQNLIQQGVYDPEQGVFTDTGEALGYGAGVGALVQGILDLMPGRTRGGAQPSEPAPEVGPQAAPLDPATLQTQPELPLTESTRPGFLGDQEQGELFVPTSPVAAQVAEVAPEPVLPEDTLRPAQLDLPLPETPATPAPVAAPPDEPAAPRVEEAVAKALAESPQLLTAIKAIEETGKVTVKTIQDALGVNQKTAISTMKELEKLGVVSKFANNKRTLIRPAALAEAPAVSEPAAVIQAAEGTTPTPTQPAPITPEAADVAQIAEAQPETVGAGPAGGTRGLGEIGRADGDVLPATGTQEPESSGLGGGLPLPVDTDAAARPSDSALSPARFDASQLQGPDRPTRMLIPGTTVRVDPLTLQPVEAPRLESSDVYAPAPVLPGLAPVAPGTVLTGSPTDLQVRDAERMLEPVRQVREVARNTELQAELATEWQKRYANKPELASLIEDYSTPDPTVSDDPTSSEDKAAIANLFKRGGTSRGDGGASGNAREYFSRFKRPIDALDFMVADATLTNQKFKDEKALEAEKGTLPEGDESLSPAEREFFSGMSRQRALSALRWVEQNMSPQTLAKVRDLQRKYRKSDEAKVQNRATSSLPTSTAVGKRPSTMSEKQALEVELEADALNKMAERARDKALADAARERMRGLEGLLAAAQETKAPIAKRAVGMRKMAPSDQIDFVVDHILGLRMNRPQDVLDLEEPLHPAVVNQLRRGNLEMAMRALQYYAPNKRTQKIARALANYAQGITVSVSSDLRDADGSALSGQFRRSASGNTAEILLDEGSGLNIQTLLHEMVHAATVKELALKTSPLRQRMENLYKATRPLLSSQNGTSNMLEFVAEAMSNPTFQRELASLHPKGRRLSAFDQFWHEATNFVRRLIGLPQRAQANALDTVDQMVFQIMTSPIGNSDGVSMANIGDAQGAAVVLNRVAQVDGSFPARAKEFGQEFGDDASRVMSGMAWGAKRTVLGFMGMQPLVDVAKHYGIKGADKLQSAIQMMDSAAIKSDSEVDGVLKIADGWIKNNPNLKVTFDRLVTRSTINQVDPALTREAALKKYGENSERMAVYDQMQKDWAAVGKDGRDLYNNMRQLYRMQYQRLRDALEGKIDFVLRDNPDMAKQVKASIYTKFFDMNQIEPYFPLARTGDFWLEYSAFDPETGTTEPVKEAYESPRARERAARELESLPNVTKGPDGKPITSFYSTVDIVERGRTPDSLFVRDTLSILRANLTNKGVDSKTADSIQEEITKLFVNALPETSFAKSMQRRKNTRGYIEDSVEALKLKGYSLGRQGVRYAYSNQIRALADDIADQGRGNDDANKAAVIEELASRADFATNPPGGYIERAAQTLNRTAFNFTLGLNVSSALVNLSSIPVVVYPYLSGRYGSRPAATAIGDAVKLFTNSGLAKEVALPAEFEGKDTTQVRAMPSIDNYYVLDNDNNWVVRDDVPPQMRKQLQELIPLIDAASKNGQLNRSIFYDSIGAEEVGRSRGFFDKMAAVSGAMFHQVERANRQVSLVASYNLELDRLRNKPTDKERGLSEAERQTRAAERAIYQTTEANGSATLAAAPRWAQKGVGRVALMFKNYGMSIFYLQMKLAKQLTLGSKDPNFTPEDRRVAFRQLMGLQLSTFALAGVSGVPLYGLVSTIANAFLGEDEEDADMLTRRYLGEGLYKGYLTDLSGMDISSRIGLTGLLIRENRYNTNPTAEETIVQNLGGPAWSTISQFGRGISEFYSAMTGGEGEMVRGIENMMPAAIRNFIKAGRYLSEGSAIDTRRGDIVVGDLGGSELLGQALGFAPTKSTLQQDINQLKVRISRNVAEKRSRLSRAYYIALRMGDIQGAQDALADIREFNEEMRDRFPGAVIDREFLKNSLKSHQRTSEQTESGVFINPAVREALADLGAQYNRGLQLF